MVGEGALGAFALLPKGLRRELARRGIRQPTPIQEKAIPLIMRGYSVVAVAPTGSGKTEAAVLPVFARLAGARPTGIGAVYITPLRSLNRDVVKRIRSYGAAVGLKVAVRHGDTPSGEKRRFLQEPPHVMVTTPETFYFMLSVPKFREHIRSLRYVIVDELHEVMSSKRGAELAVALSRVERWYVGKRLQMIGLSATVHDPLELGRRLMRGRYFVVVEAGGGHRSRIVVDTIEGGLTERASLIASYVEGNRGVTIVFTNTRDTAEILGAMLKVVLGEEDVEVHHGSLSKDVRLRAEERLRLRRVKAVVATSSLELGIDVGDVDQVVQYMSPRQAIKLVQRVGRARHRMGEEARGVVVATDNVFDILESAVLAARGRRGDLEPLPFFKKPYDVLIHQLVGLVLERGSVGLKRAYSVVTSSSYYEELSYDEFLAVTEFASKLRLLRIDGDELRPGPRAKSYYFSTTMIPDVKHYPVKDIESGRQIGVLDEEFAASLERGAVFVLSGSIWEVVDAEGDAVLVRPARADMLVAPSWEGDLIPVEWKVAREVGSIFRRIELYGEEVLRHYPLTRRAREVVLHKLRGHLGKGLPLPSDKRLVVEVYENTAVLYTFLGSRGNKALEYLLAEYVEQTLGYPPSTGSTPYIVTLRFASKIEPSYVQRMLNNVSRLPVEELREMVYSAVRRSRLYEWVLYAVAQRSGVVDVKEHSLAKVRHMLRSLKDTVLGEEALREISVRKLDMEALLAFIDELRKGKRIVEIVWLREASPLTLDAVSEARTSERMRPERLPSTIVVEVVRRKLATRMVRLVCMNCGHFWRARVGALPEKLRCEKCGSGMIALVYSDEEASKARSLVRKIRNGARLARSEKKAVKELMERANLVLEYGRRAIEALIYPGVGVHTAKQVLRTLVFGEARFYQSLVEAEARYHMYKHKLRAPRKK